MQIREVMTPKPDVVGPDVTIDVTARQMKQRNIGAFPVCNGDQLVGLITDRDIAVRAVAQGLNPSNTPVREAMNLDLFYCFEDQEVREAANLMREKQIRRVPVLSREKKLVGMLSLGDIAVGGDSDSAAQALKGISEPAAPAEPRPK